MQSSSYNLLNRIQDILENMKVEKYVFICSDPDSDKAACGCKGDVCWRVGAMRYRYRQVLNDKTIVIGKSSQLAKIKEMFANLGVTSYVMVFSVSGRLPDIVYQGDFCWMVGALSLQIRQFLREWDDDSDDVYDFQE